MKDGKLLFMEEHLERQREQRAQFHHLMREGRLVVHMVDHNELAWFQDFLAPFVVSILDHHKNSGIPYVNLKEKVIKPDPKIKSASSLVTERLLGFEKEGFVLDVSWNFLLLAPVLLDTMNLEKEEIAGEDENEIETLDEAIARRLISDIQVSEPGFSQNDFFSEVFAARSNTENFSALDLLKRDKKRYCDGGKYYVLCSVYKWNDDEEGYETALEEYRKSLGYSLAAVMEFPHTGERRFIVNADDQEFLNKMSEFLGSQMAYLVEEDLSSVSATLFLPKRMKRKVLQPLLKGLWNLPV